MTILSKDDALAAAQAALDKKAYDVVLLDIANIVAYADYFLICSGRSTTQVRAIVDGVAEHFKLKGITPHHIEGATEGRWVLLDFDEVIVHVFLEEARDFYDLERLWWDAPRTEFAEQAMPEPFVDLSGFRDDD